MNTKWNLQTFLGKSKAMDNVIYFNNAATSYPKPDIVNRSVIDSLYYPPIDSTRVCNCKKSNNDIDILCKFSIKEFFNLSKEYEVIFTSGATHSINIVVNYLSNLGCTKAITTKQEHNSIYRTLNAYHFNINYLNFNKDNQIELDELEDYLTSGSEIVCVNHECNVDGNLIDIVSISKICKKYNCPLIIDITQSAGTEKIDFSDLYECDNIYIVCSGHKGLYSIPGFGFLIKPVSCKMTPLIFGGTGKNSSDTISTDSLEAGTQNYFGVVSLLAGLNYIKDVGISYIQNRKKHLRNYYLSHIKNIDSYQLYSNLFKDFTNIDSNSGIVSLGDNFSAAIEFVNQLKNNRIIVRHGLHCSPLYHMDVLKVPSTVRLSFGIFNTVHEIDRYFNVVDNILIKNYNYYKQSIFKII